jgi:hypothetical protein
MIKKNLGCICLIIQILLSIVPWVILEEIPIHVGNAILIISSILSILMWYEAIRISMEKSIKDGLKVSGFFLIPCALVTVFALLGIGSKSDAGLIVAIPWLIFTLPFRIVSDEHTKTMIKGISEYFYTLGPIAIFVLIIIVNLILYKGKSFLRKNQ